MTPRRYRLAVLGGTFDRLHPGHRALLRAAFAGAEAVRIGLTTRAYLARHPKPLGERIASYRARRTALAGYLRRTYPGRDFRILPLADGLGRSVEPGPDLLVISAATRAGGRAVNRERARRGLPPLDVRVVRLVRDPTGRPYSSRRRRARELAGRDRKNR